MASILQLAKNVDNHTRLVVHGYIHDMQKSCKDMVIPDVIIDCCIAFYYLQLLWDLSRFSDEQDSIFIKPKRNHWCTVTLNQSISNRLCNIFEFEITVNKIKDNGSNHFFIGFIKNSAEYVNRAKDMGNESYSECIKLQRNEILLNSHGNHVGKLPRRLEAKDKIRFVVDFKADNCCWYWNDKQEPLVTRELNGEVHAIIPALSPYWKASEFEITNYCFRY